MFWGLDIVKICVVCDLDGQRIDTNQLVLDNWNAVLIYEELLGWSEDITEFTKDSENARNYVRREQDYSSYQFQ